MRGALQLPPGALLLLDETAMGAGAIGEAGVRSLQALSRVLSDQQLPIDFQFYQVGRACALLCACLCACLCAVKRLSSSDQQLPIDLQFYQVGGRQGCELGALHRSLLLAICALGQLFKFGAPQPNSNNTQRTQRT